MALIQGSITEKNFVDGNLVLTVLRENGKQENLLLDDFPVDFNLKGLPLKIHYQSINGQKKIKQLDLNNNGKTEDILFSLFPKMNSSRITRIAKKYPLTMDLLNNLTEIKSRDLISKEKIHIKESLARQIVAPSFVNRMVSAGLSKNKAKEILDKVATNYPDSGLELTHILNTKPYDIVHFLPETSVFNAIDNIFLTNGGFVTSQKRLAAALHIAINTAIVNKGSYSSTLKEVYNHARWYIKQNTPDLSVYDNMLAPVLKELITIHPMLKHPGNSFSISINPKTGQESLLWKNAFWAELHSANRLLEFKEAEPTNSYHSTIIQKVLEQIKETDSLILDENQDQAIYNAMNNHLSIITGPPGTGKTTVLKALCQTIQSLCPHWQIALAAPTGIASKRMEEATGLPAKTLHNLLKIKPNTTRSFYNYKKGIVLDANVLIVDEASMINSNIFLQLLNAVNLTPNFRLILVGDANQLPPIGMGQPFKDIVDSTVFSTAFLTTIYRTGNDAKIPNFAKNILEKKDDFSGITIINANKENITQKIKKIALEKKEANMMILSPVRERTILSTNNINELLQTAINQNKKPSELTKFKIGDPIIQIRNLYLRSVNPFGVININLETPKIEIDTLIVANGAKGIVKKINEQEITIRFPQEGINVIYTLNDADLWIELGYCLTVHKAQGSEADIVMLPILQLKTGAEGKGEGIWNKTLLYTAATRAKKELILIGNKTDLKNIISNEQPKRRTIIAKMLAK